ncbi:thioredoxin reductase [Paenibacillus sp. DS2015]|uniref:FAD-dependent oxidoreductase n=1 Tax=Paenibacillus sp. DS2015 TaxID=3373917 RepID=UPI003D23503F
MADIIIIGAGPAGGSAAIFSAKAGKETIVIDSNASMTKRAWIENHYGVKEIAGPELLQTGREQAEKFGAVFVEDKVIGITSDSNSVKVSTESGQSYEAAHVILATGVSTELASTIGLKLKDGVEPRIKTIVEVDAEGRTSLPRVWATGTIAGVSVHTIITAGDGARVAIGVISSLNGTRYVDHDVIK